MKDKVSIIIPAYNEEKSITQVVTDIKEHFPLYELIVVNDCSTDKTAELAEAAGAKVINHIMNHGYGAALKTGLRHSDYEIIVIIDADGTYPYNKIHDLVKIYQKENADMVVGARINADAKIPLIRKPAKWIITKLASFLVQEKIPDLNSGLRVMKKAIVNKYIKLLPDGFSFTSTITLAMLTNDCHVIYEPIDYFYRKGKSKIRPIHDTINFIQLIVRTILYFKPLRIFLALSLPLILSGFMIILFQAVYFRNISTIAVIISLTGIQLLGIGMLADLIVKRKL